MHSGECSVRILAIRIGDVIECITPVPAGADSKVLRTTKRRFIMNERNETVKALREKINECDELIVEISQLRYRLDTILSLMDTKPTKPALRRWHKHSDSDIVA